MANIDGLTPPRVPDRPVPFDRLHPSRIDDPDQIRALLDRLRRERVVLCRGMNRKIDLESAWIEALDEREFHLRTCNFEMDSKTSIFFNFKLDGLPHFFAAPLLEHKKDGYMLCGVPTIVYQAERRDHIRRAPSPGDGQRVSLTTSNRDRVEAEIADYSAEGLGVLVSRSDAARLANEVELRFVDGSRAGQHAYGTVRQKRDEGTPRGWTRIGLDVTETPVGGAIARESLDEALPPTLSRDMARRIKVAAAAVQLAVDRAKHALVKSQSKRPSVRVVEFKNDQGEYIRAIIDSWGTSPNATTVVIPPAWGRTKESLMPLASCLVSAFRGAGRPVTVVRFDGIRKRGESYNDPDCREPGHDHHRFTFSQGVRDITATLDFLERSEEFSPGRTILVSFSAASIEARRAVAIDRRIDGWISVVGAADLQYMMRVISGGVDYALGLERGVRFGLQQILGIDVDMDHAGLDAFRHSLVYMEDSRKDMSRIRVPVTWIHGQHDAWMDADRAIDILSRGETSNRRFIEVPTGHMLKTSSEALRTFELVVSEVSRVALGTPIEPRLPDLAGLEARRQAERARLNKVLPDLRAFWKDYLVGRDDTMSIELMHSISPYRDLMKRQVEGLSLDPDGVVVDLGCGTGAFPVHLLDEAGKLPCKIIEIDYVRSGLRRARSRVEDRSREAVPEISFLESDLDSNGIPLADESIDGVLAALLISYVRDPLAVLREIHRVLRPGGRLVVSSLKRDADMSKLYREGIAELRQGRAREFLGPESESEIDRLARGYLNEASRLLDFEEDGTFRFWDDEELERLVRRAGFAKVSSQRALGSPPQAVIVSAARR